MDEFDKALSSIRKQEMNAAKPPPVSEIDKRISLSELIGNDPVKAKEHAFLYGSMIGVPIGQTGFKGCYDTYVQKICSIIGRDGVKNER